MPEVKTPPKDRRLVATFGIMGAALGMLALCIPLCMITDNDALPLWTIASSAVATLGVWFFGKPKAIDERQRKEIKELQTTIVELKERLENVEVMNRFETKLAESHSEEEENAPVTRTMGPVSD